MTIPGMRVLLDSTDEIFTSAARSIFKVAIVDPRIVVASNGTSHTVAVAPLLLHFTTSPDTDDIAVVPWLMAMKASDRAPRNFDAQAAIDAFENLLFRRCMPEGGVQ